MDRANLAHAVQTIGAASRSLDRLPEYANVAAEVRGIWEQLTQDLMTKREEEKREREAK